MHFSQDDQLYYRVDGGEVRTVAAGANVKLSEEERLLAEVLYKLALKHSSKYVMSQYPSPRLRIETIQAGVGDIAIHHFSKLVEHFQKFVAKTSALRVVFKEINGHQMEAVDAGGLTRDFMIRLFGGLLKDPTCALKMEYNWKEGGLPMPKAAEQPITEALPVEPDADISKHFPELNKDERTQYQQVGYMQMYCFRSKEQYACVSGQIFHQDLFSAMQKIPYEQAVQEKPNWSWATCFPLIEQLAKNQGGRSNTWVEYLKNPTDTSKNMIVQDFRDLSMAPPAWGDEGEVSKEKVTEYLRNELIQQYSGYISALHAIAHGMMRRIQNTSFDPKADWIEFATKENVQDIIQGVLNRKQIADNCTIAPECGEIIRQKVKWFRNWILKEDTSEKDLRLILRFITGASAIPPGTKLAIAKQGVGQEIPYPQAHTCFKQIDLADKYFTGSNPDNTEEEFIQRMLEAAKGTVEAGFNMV